MELGHPVRELGSQRSPDWSPDWAGRAAVPHSLGTESGVAVGGAGGKAKLDRGVLVGGARQGARSEGEVGCERGWEGGVSAFTPYPRWAPDRPRSESHGHLRRAQG